MEKRAILAALLMAGLLMVYQILFVKPQEPQPQAPAQQKSAPVASAPMAAAPAAPSSAAPVPPKEAPVVPERKALVETPLYRAILSSQGGRFAAWELKYRGQKPMIVDGELGPRGLSVVRGGGPPQRIAFTVSPDSLTLTKAAAQGEMKLVGEDGFGLRITETLRFRADSYVVEHDIKVENRHTVAQSADIMLGWTAPVEWPKDRDQRFQGQHPIRTVRLVGGSAQREDLAKVGSYQGPGAWVGLESEWYLTAFVPRGGSFQLAEAKHTESKPGVSKPSEMVEVGLRGTLPSLQPGESWEGRVLTYIGPKEYGRLKGGEGTAQPDLH